MKCKNCDKQLVGLGYVTFEKSVAIGAGKFAGSYEYEKQVYEDGGVFCNEGCLFYYLKRFYRLS